MFSYIKGVLDCINSDSIVVENNGIGFELKTSENVIKKLPSIGEKVKIYTYMHVREDDISLFGFLTEEEIKIFKLLINVNGIGPKGALAILSCLTVSELGAAIISGDAKSISKANGIGAKTAQRVILDMKDKIDVDALFSGYNDIDSDDVNNNAFTDANVGDKVSDVVLALTTLGYSNIEAMRAVKKVKNIDELSEEQILKAALKTMI